MKLRQGNHSTTVKNQINHAIFTENISFNQILKESNTDDMNFKLNDLSFMQDVIQLQVANADQEINQEITKDRTDIEKDCNQNEGVKTCTLAYDVPGAVMQVLVENRALMNYFVNNNYKTELFRMLKEFYV